jgi:hypothetical protein
MILGLRNDASESHRAGVIEDGGYSDHFLYPVMAFKMSGVPSKAEVHTVSNDPAR